MDVDHAAEAIMVGTGDTTATVETLTILITIGIVGGMTATGTLAETNVANIAITTGTAG